MERLVLQRFNPDAVTNAKIGDNNVVNTTELGTGINLTGKNCNWTLKHFQTMLQQMILLQQLDIHPLETL